MTIVSRVCCDEDATIFFVREAMLTRRAITGSHNVSKACPREVASSEYMWHVLIATVVLRLTSYQKRKTVDSA